PAFVLSQDQTLQTKTPTQQCRHDFQSEKMITNKRHQKLASKKQPHPKREKECGQKTTNKNHQTHY
ncbi:hypothetical protein, partial [Mycolicibacterium insubricum]|uniref:hypothetical protein n=1 Tax=Mycolicibacterium insubricum TaxID=444597 RepID=UPI0021F26CC2